MTAGSPQRTAVLTCVRNEGMWLLEWVAYHRAIGFDEIFIASNDCTDGSDAMLDRLEQMGLIHHIRTQARPGISPQEAGCAQALAHPAMVAVDWVLHIDVDEFLMVHIGAGGIQDLLAEVGEADVIALTWRMFGSGGRRLWPGGSVLQSCTRSEAGCAGAARCRNAPSAPRCSGGSIPTCRRTRAAPMWC